MAGDVVKTATLGPIATSTRSLVVDTAGYSAATVGIKAASGSPDGTVTIKADSGVTLATYATPTTLKVYRGPTSGTLSVELTANTTGTVYAEVRLKS